MRYADEPDLSGKRVVVCDLCGYTRHTEWPIEQIHHSCQGTVQPKGLTDAELSELQQTDHTLTGIPRPVLPPVEEGPGTELHKLIAELGITPTASCGCDSMRKKMNDWGPAGCREHREEILAHLRAAYDEASVLTKLRVGAAALNKGLPLSLAGLLDEAIRRAEQAAK